MNTEAKEGVRELRRLPGQTQAEFAAMIGASKDTVVSWECGRNRLSMTFARGIAVATGVDGDCLLKGVRVRMTADPLSNPRVFRPG
jgi:DNA-binding XRE family transcriptional regulator